MKASSWMKRFARASATAAAASAASTAGAYWVAIASPLRARTGACWALLPSVVLLTTEFERRTISVRIMSAIEHPGARGDTRGDAPYGWGANRVGGVIPLRRSA